MTPLRNKSQQDGVEDPCVAAFIAGVVSVIKKHRLPLSDEKTIAWMQLAFLDFERDYKRGLPTKLLTPPEQR